MIDKQHVNDAINNQKLLLIVVYKCERALSKHKLRKIRANERASKNKTIERIRKTNEQNHNQKYKLSDYKQFEFLNLGKSHRSNVKENDEPNLASTCK